MPRRDLRQSKRKNYKYPESFALNLGIYNSTTCAEVCLTNLESFKSYGFGVGGGGGGGL